MSDFLTAIGAWIDSRITRRGGWYKFSVGLLFLGIIGLFFRDIKDMFAGAE